MSVLAQIALLALGSGGSGPEVSGALSPSMLRCRGRIAAQPFLPERAELSYCGKQGNSAESRAYILTIREGSGFFAERELQVFFHVEKAWGLSRLHIVAPQLGRPTRAQGISSIQLNYMQPGKSLPKTEVYMDRFVARLEIDGATNSEASGRIHVMLPDGRRSFASGTFRARVVDLTR